MSWSKPEDTSWGGVKKTSDSGKGSLYSKDNGSGDVDRKNHAHFHDDGVTLTREKTHYLQIKQIVANRKIDIASSIIVELAS